MDVDIISSGSVGNAYIVSDNETMVLLDAGVSIRRIQEACNFKLSGVSGCLCNHSHSDHSKAIKDLAKKGIDIYSNAETFEKVPIAAHREHVVNQLQKFMVGTFEVLPFPLVHDVSNTGYMLTSKVTGERLLYITDTSYIEYVFPPCNIMLIEANHDSEDIYSAVNDGRTNSRLAGRVFGSHMSIETLSEFLSKQDCSKLDTIYLIHLSDNHSNAEEFKARIQKEIGCAVYVC